MRLPSVVFVLIGLAAVDAAAQRSSLKWECRFTTSSVYRGGDEGTRNPQKYAVGPELFELTFLETPEKAYALGNNGSAEVVRVRTDRGGVQFIEKTTSGAIQLTAIDQYGNGAHSRSTVNFDGKLLAAQHYGTCSAK